MTYCNSADVFNYLGKSAKTKVRSEVVGTSSNTASTSWELDHDNVIDASDTIYTDSTVVPTSSYSINLDDGKLTGLSVPSGSVLTADYDYSGMSDSMVQQMITSSDSLIEVETGRVYTTTTSTTEYLSRDPDQKVFFLNDYPITTLTLLERNTAAQVDAAVWESLTEGLGEDYLSNSEDLLVGRIRFIDSFPLTGQDTLRATYISGYTTVPALVKELSMLLTIRQMANSTVYKSIIEGQDNYTPVRLDEINNRIEELKRVLTKQNISLI